MEKPNENNNPDNSEILDVQFRLPINYDAIIDKLSDPEAIKMYVEMSEQTITVLTTLCKQALERMRALEIKLYGEINPDTKALLVKLTELYTQQMEVNKRRLNGEDPKNE